MSVAALAAAVLIAINGARADHGMRPLRSADGPHVAALNHARNMARYGYFSHSYRGSFGWLPWPTWLRRHLLRCGAAENILWSTGSPSAGLVARAWMASPEHRRNILLPWVRSMGAGAARGSGRTYVSLVEAGC